MGKAKKIIFIKDGKFGMPIYKRGFAHQCDD